MDYIKINIIFSFLRQDSSFFSLFQVEKCVSRKENILTVKKEKKQHLFPKAGGYLKRMRELVAFRRRLGPEMQPTKSQTTLAKPISLARSHKPREWLF